MERKQKKILQVFNIVGFFATIIVNALANILPINGKNTGELSDSYPNLFVPAGLTFSIWGVIYLLLTLFTIYQAKDLFKSEEDDMPWLGKIGYLNVILSAANVSWILFWHYEFVGISLIVMLVILATLLAIYLRLGIGKNEEKDSKVRWFVETPFSVYLGWISVATIANVTAFAVDISWNGWGISEEIWTILVIIVGAILGSLMLITRKDIPYSLVIIWAYIGIVIKRLDPAFIPQPNIVTTAIISIIVLVIEIILVILKKLKK